MVPRTIAAVRSTAETPQARAAEYDRMFEVYQAAFIDAKRKGLTAHAHFCWAKCNAYLDAWEDEIERPKG